MSQNIKKNIHPKLWRFYTFWPSAPSWRTDPELTPNCRWVASYISSTKVWWIVCLRVWINRHNQKRVEVSRGVTTGWETSRCRNVLSNTVYTSINLTGLSILNLFNEGFNSSYRAPDIRSLVNYKWNSKWYRGNKCRLLESNKRQRKTTQIFTQNSWSTRGMKLDMAVSQISLVSRIKDRNLL